MDYSIILYNYNLFVNVFSTRLALGPLMEFGFYIYYYRALRTTMSHLESQIFIFSGFVNFSILARNRHI